MWVVLALYDRETECRSGLRLFQYQATHYLQSMQVCAQRAWDSTLVAHIALHWVDDRGFSQQYPQIVVNVCATVALSVRGLGLL